MQINHAFPLSALQTRPLWLACGVMLALSGCDGMVPRTSEPAPSHQATTALPQPLPPRAPVAVVPPPRPAPPALAPAPGQDWRDLPLPPGDWLWQPHPTGDEARYGLPGAMPVAVLRCDRATGVIRIALPIDPAQTATMPATMPTGLRSATITTSTTTGAVEAEPLSIDGMPTLAITLPAGHRLWDAMAFSRGRVRITIAGTAPVVLPAWSQIGRVVEDCRG
ncbi:hypothetical protein [Novosphingobium sp.]|uniref:hypothetical protein n=1 Tax=Novosphingobium sp. TaxID=1874826 RepID=UPI003342683C